MTEFIHFLAIPACIVSFKGDIVDVNDLMLKDSKAATKFEFTNHSIPQLCADESKLKRIVDTILSEGSIKNLSLFVKIFDGGFDIRIFNISLISKEKELMLFQNYGAFKEQQFFMEKIDKLIIDFEKLRPYLNKNGKEILEQIIERQKDDLMFLKQSPNIDGIARNIEMKNLNLTESEILICSLLYLGFSTKEKVKLTGFTANKIRVNIHRICKKLNFSSREELVDFLKNSLP